MIYAYVCTHTEAQGGLTLATVRKGARNCQHSGPGQLLLVDVVMWVRADY